MKQHIFIENWCISISPAYGGGLYISYKDKTLCLTLRKGIFMITAGGA
jgi:hypothetical protein